MTSSARSLDGGCQDDTEEDEPPSVDEVVGDVVASVVVGLLPEQSLSCV